MITTTTTTTRRRGAGKMKFCGFVLLFVVSTISCQESTTNKTANVRNECSGYNKCGECIAADPKCAWCKAEETLLQPRCELYSKLHTYCAIKDIINPGNTMTPVDNKPLSTAGTQPAEVIQIAPQRVNLKLRPGLPFELPIHFRQAEDYPVDLYYLMDLSKSMEDDKDKLATLGDLLAEEMSKITKNFRLGFGSFVDKVVMPYVSTVPEKLKEPCLNCAAPYGFKNHMQLSVKTAEFKKKVSEARVSGNLDAPEGGFDAIMQSMVCEREIGWRPQSRKLVVFSTDSGFHYAGDGKLGGIVKPNDGHCHLDGTGFYTASTSMDYPSLSQLNQKSKEKSMTIIFAVTANQFNVYKRLSDNLESASAGQLEDDSSNVVQLIKDQYQKITSSVTLTDTANDDYIRVSYYTKCLSGTVMENKKTCKGLRVGDSVSFEVTIEVKSCPVNRSEWNQVFTISPIGLNESVTVNLQMLCECDCEKLGEGEPFSKHCNESGTYQCGVCKCPEDRYGLYCQCTEAKKDDTDAACIQPKKTEICSGRGSCNCGVCECFQDLKGHGTISGTYCQCDSNSCRRHKGLVCNGKGSCGCDGCNCYEGWTGEACECPTSNKDCIAPGTTEVCSGFGNCTCGKCSCQPGKGSAWRTGRYCEECPDCKGKCSDYKNCVQCKTFQTGEYDTEQCESNCTFPLNKTAEAKPRDKEQLCIFKDDDDCKFTFVYGYDDDNEVYVRVQSTKDCPSPVNILMIVLGVIGGIVAIGLCLLLIWKLLTTIHDRREFAKFEKDRQMAKWDTGENPIFKQATSTFKNPTYGGK